MLAVTNLNRRSVPLAAVAAAGAVALAFIAACADDDEAEPIATATTVSIPTPAPRLTLTGALTLDGEPFDAQFMGVWVIRDGLAAICQARIPPVTGGSYDIDVLSDTEGRGCGADGAQLLLWVYVNEAFHYAPTTVGWQDGGTLLFDAGFSTGDPAGASLPSTGFRGEATDGDGNLLPPGTVIEAYVGDVLCGVTSLRGGDFEGYSIIVAGPEGVAECTEGATVRFRIGGQPAAQTGVNDLLFDDGHVLDLSQS